MPERTAAQLSPNELSLLLDAMLCVPGGLANLKVDYERLAEVRNFKNKASATTAWYNLRRKLLEMSGQGAGAGAGADADASESVPATPKKTPGRVTKRTPRSSRKSENWKTGVSALLASDDEIESTKKGIMKKEVDE
ncbi:hypothetical protein KEM56_000901 [Ascosphaera pollenicola]|nr:hypothetical protein KEM56_000901 [Ascosphaera pollenicola]